jgi:hypothetical protein
MKYFLGNISAAVGLISVMQSTVRKKHGMANRKYRMLIPFVFAAFE